MWQLHMTNEAREWGLVGRFETIGEAVRRITERVGAARTGLFLRTYVDPLSSDDEALRDLEYKGARAAYVIRRERQTH
jgi:predicted nucleotidyltransferase